jgi:hypothetical protein
MTDENNKQECIDNILNKDHIKNNILNEGDNLQFNNDNNNEEEDNDCMSFADKILNFEVNNESELINVSNKR